MATARSNPYDKVKVAGERAIKDGPKESQRQDMAWQGNSGSKEKLDRNHAGTSEDTVRSAFPTRQGLPHGVVE